MPQETVEIPITGKILSVDIKPGDTVQEGDTLCMLESMKMENPILSPVSGKVSKVGVAVNQTVQPGDVVAVIDY